MSRLFTIDLGSLCVQIDCLYDTTWGRCREYLTNRSAPDIRLRMTKEDVEEERARAEAQFSSAGRELPVLPPEDLEWISFYRKLGEELPEFDALIFHGAAVAVSERAFVFTAPPGTGKSTHAKLWMKAVPGCRIINGDKPILRLVDGRVMVCGTPWAGKEGWQAPISVPLGALCLLERGEENRIEPTDFHTLFPTLVSQSFRPQRAEALRSTLRVLETAGRTAGLFRLHCNMEPEAARVAYDAMKG